MKEIAMTNFLKCASCAICISLALSACATETRPVSTSSATHTPKIGGDASESRYYGSLKQVSAASEVVVVAEPTGRSRLTPADADNISGEVATLSEMRIISLLKGRQYIHSTGATFTLRQFGSMNSDTIPEEIVSSGTQYMLFLKRFEFVPGKPLDQWSSITLDVFYAKRSGEVSFSNRSVHGIGQLETTTTPEKVEQEIAAK